MCTVTERSTNPNRCATAADALELEPDASRAAARISDAVEALLPAADGSAGRPTLFLLFDGLVPHIASVLDGLYLRLADQVAYTGVNAGSEQRLAVHTNAADFANAG